MLELSPNYAVSYCSRGVALKALGRIVEAIASYDHAIRLDPNYSEAFANRGVALQAVNRLNEALDSLNLAIEVDPDNPRAYFNRGNVLREMGELDQAVASFDSALELLPEFPQAYCNRAATLVDLSHYQAALASYRKAVRLKPVYPEVFFSIGNVLKLMGNVEGALSNYEAAIKQRPAYVEAHNNRGVVLEELGRLEEALRSYTEALRLNPNYVEAYSNRGVALQELSQLDEALENFNFAIQLKPDYAQAYYNKANVLRDLGRLHEAHDNHTTAIGIRPGFAEAFANRGNVLQDLGRLEEARSDYEAAIVLDPDYELAYTSLLMLLNYMPEEDPGNRYELASKFGNLARKLATRPFETYRCDISPEKLRVGVVSGDLQSHPVGYFLESILAAMNGSTVELVAYSNSLYIDALTERLKPFFNAWHVLVGLSNQQAAGRIHQDGIHVLIDLSGHTQKHRLPVFCYRPAPIQVTWLGYFSTTGLKEIDYILGDPHVTPKHTTEQFTETIWRLPDSRWCASEPEYSIQLGPLPALTNGYITFGCFGNYTKINDQVISLWCEILAALPTSKLFLKAKQFRDELVISEAITRFTELGIETDRIIIEQPESRHHYFEVYNRIDITLDTFPFTGGTTSVDSLWMGVPVLTLAGDTMVARQGVGVLATAGLHDWIAKDREEYLRKAVQFAENLSGLETLRQGLRRQVTSSALFDAGTFAGHLQEALWAMWQKYQSNAK
ncbi:MAG: tetratricopeptide repeat protein [Pseudohongiellaceae bacterium]